MRQAIFGLLFLSMTLTAQPDRKRRPPMDHPGQRLEMMKMWRLTEELDLSEEQAGKFFPRYNALEKEIMEMNKDQKEILGSLLQKENSGKEISQKELDEITFMENLRKGIRDRMKGPSGKKRYMKKMNGKMRKDGWRY